MPVSPLCQVKDGTGAYRSTASAVAVTPGNTITIHLIDSSANSWSISCDSTDEGSDAAAVNASLSLDVTARTASFTAPESGHSYIFRSVINSGVSNGRVNSTYATTFIVYTPTGAGRRVLALNEAAQAGAFGWLPPVNDIIRNGGGGGGRVITDDVFQVDPVSGSDSGTGLVGSPVQTWDRLMQLWGINPVLNPASGLLTIQLLGDLPATDPIYMRGAVIARDSVVLIKGTSTTVHSGTFTAHTAQVPSTNTPNDVTDSGLPSAGAWTTYVGNGNRIRVTSGANVGMVAWPGIDAGAKRAIISTPQTLINIAQSAPSIGVIANDAYVLEAMSSVVIAEIDINADTGSSDNSYPRLTFEDLTIQPSGGDLAHTNYTGMSVLRSSADIFFVGCAINAFIVCLGSSVLNGVVFANCLRGFPFTFNFGTYVAFLGGLVLNTTVFQRGTGNTILDNHVMFVGSNFVAGKGGRGTIGLACFFNTTSNTLQSPGAIFTQFGSCIEYDENYNLGHWGIWGSGNTGPVLFVEAGGRFLYEEESGSGMATFTATTTGDVIQLAGANTGRAWNESTGAWTSAISLTPANIAAAIGSSGFGGSAHNVARDAAICLIYGT